MNKHVSRILLLLFFVTAFLSHETKGQTDNDKNRQLVLSKNIIDSLFVFGKWTKDGGTETHLKYLGSATTISDGRVFKIMNSVLHWGHSHRATSRILLFDSKNKYLGNYHVSTVQELPIKLEKGQLIFKNDSDDCGVKTVVDLTESIPEKIFIKCKGDNGDFIFFTREE